MQHIIGLALGTNLLTLAILACSAELHAQTRAGDVIVNSIGMKLAYIPPGEFLMGTPRKEAREAHLSFIAKLQERHPERDYSFLKVSDEEKPHRVRITQSLVLPTFPWVA